jgi:hypothetical protein
LIKAAFALLIVAGMTACAPPGGDSTAATPAPQTEAHKEATMLVTYGRSGGGRTGPDELVIDGDGTFELWRSSHAGPVGRFAGTLDDDTLGSLRAEVDAATTAGPLEEGVRLPGGRTEEIRSGDLAVVMPDEDPGGPWGVLAARLRGLLDELTAFPAAAVALEVRDDGATLRHSGTEPLTLRLGDLGVHVIRYGPGYARQDEWRSPPAAGASEPVAAQPGWSLDLPFDHGLPVQPDDALQVVVSLEAFRGPAAYPVQVVQAPQL